MKRQQTFGGSFDSKKKNKAKKINPVLWSQVVWCLTTGWTHWHLRGLQLSQDILMRSLASQSTQTLLEGLRFMVWMRPTIWTTALPYVVTSSVCTDVLFCFDHSFLFVDFMFFPRVSHLLSSHADVPIPIWNRAGKVFLCISLS